MTSQKTRRPTATDARVSCPACGRRLHERERHVRADLASEVQVCPVCRTRFPLPPGLQVRRLGQHRRQPTPPAAGLVGVIRLLSAALAELWKICREPPKRSRKARRWSPFRLDGARGFAAYPVSGGWAGATKGRNGAAAHELFRQRRGRIL